MDKLKKNRQRKKLKKISRRPILMVYKSNRHIYGQLIDQSSGEVIAAASDFDIKRKPKKSKERTSKEKIGEKIGEIIAKQAKKKKVKKIVFDRSGHPFQGIVKAIAQGAKEGGLDF